MDKLKNQIITALCENARYTNAELAKMFSVEESTINEVVNSLEKDGVIVKYSAIINSETLPEKPVQALIEVKVAPQRLKGFDSCAEEIYNFPEVKSLYLMSGGFDLAIFVEDKSLTDVAKFVSEKLSVVDGIISVQTHFILKKYKIEGQITKPSEERKRQIVQA
ncbi:MAG: Lrp/AsnC family transcriptional regulator [Clostridia bacterium]|nr:Lrp/AsnC family transcriptional regulator [Clostridia bacterium]